MSFKRKILSIIVGMILVIGLVFPSFMNAGCDPPIGQGCEGLSGEYWHFSCSSDICGNASGTRCWYCFED